MCFSEHIFHMMSQKHSEIRSVFFFQGVIQQRYQDTFSLIFFFEFCLLMSAVWAQITLIRYVFWYTWWSHFISAIIQEVSGVTISNFRPFLVKIVRKSTNFFGFYVISQEEKIRSRKKSTSIAIIIMMGSRFSFSKHFVRGTTTLLYCSKFL